MIKGISKKRLRELDKKYGGIVPKTPSIGTVTWDKLTDKDKEDIRRVQDGTMPGAEFPTNNTGGREY